MKKSLFLSMFLLLGMLLNAQISSFPYSESWEGGATGSWTQPTSDDFDWTNYIGSTNTNNTGPTAASDGTNYLYTETSPVSNGDIAIIENDFDFSNLSRPELLFDYHMYFNGASNGGTLAVDVSTDGGVTWTNEWSKSGDQGNQWHVGAIVDLLSYGTDTVKIRFHFTTGQNNFFQNDAAIDALVIQQQAACPRPLNLNAMNITSTRATIAWDSVATATGGYEIIFDTAGFDPSTSGTSLTSQVDSIGLTGLVSATSYDVYVISDCGTVQGMGDTAGPFSFLTLCTPFTSPYSQNFDQATNPNLPICWSSYIIGSTAAVETDNRTTGTIPRSAPNQLFLDNDSRFSNDTVAAISPQFSDMPSGDKWVKFYVAAEFASSSVDLWIGTMSDPTRGSTISILDTVVVQGNNTYRKVKVTLDSANGYNGTDQYVVLMHDNSNSFDGIMIDDFVYEPISPCRDPRQATLSNITDSSAVVDFVSSNNAATFEFNWGSCGFTQGAANSNFGSGNKPFTLNGLSPNTCYEVFIRSDCGPVDGKSDWVGPLQFQTDCSFSTAPYFQNFDQAIPPNLPACWSAYIRGSTGVVETDNRYFGTPRARSGPNQLFLENGTNNHALAAISPQFGDMPSGDKRVKFWVAAEFSNDKVDLWVGTMSNPSQGATISIIDTVLVQGNTVHQEAIVNLDSANGYNGTDQYVVLMHDDSNPRDGIMIDDFTYEQITNCSMPRGLATTVNVDCYSIELDWISNTGSSIIKWGKQGFTPGTGNFTGTVSAPYTITGLVPNTTYDFWIADTCGNDTSSFRGPITVTTSNLLEPVAEIGVVGDTIIGGFCALTVDGSQSQFVDTYSWDFDNNVTSNLAIPTVTFVASGTYNIVLTVNNACASDTDTLMFNTSSCFVGLKENTLSRSLNLYPNPTSKLVKIEFETPRMGDVEVLLTDLRGRVMMEHRDNQVNGSYSKTFDVSSLANGVYMVEITSGELRAVRRLNVR